jgi:aryl-alcohol dehydrogenase-like predicted oxidoreductase
MIAGWATPEGTARFRARHQEASRCGHFRALGELEVSSIGLGTYLGDPSDSVDEDYVRAITEALALGCNLFDTAISYRHGRSERALGRALKQAFASGLAARDEVVVCSKGGADSLDASQLGADLDHSRANLGLDTVDIYYLNNPETEPSESGVVEFELREALSTLAERCERGHVSGFGLASWSGLRQPPGSPGTINLERVVNSAAAGLVAVQAPLNLAMPEALASPTQELGGVVVPLAVAARSLGLGLITSASILQGQLARLPPEMAERFPEFDSDAQRALQFTRSLPGVTTALVGMSSVEHVRENLALAEVPPAPIETVQRFFA